MGSLSDGFFSVIGGFLAFILIFAVLGIIFYLCLKNGVFTGLGKGIIKNLVGLN